MAGEAHFGPDFFKFLGALAANNRREWFLAHRDEYESSVRQPFLGYIADFGPRLRTISRHLVADPRPVGGSLFRIHRDVRFSRDKSPYKTHAAAYFAHRGAGQDVHVPGFYLHLEPRGCFGAAGLWHPGPKALDQVRRAIIARPAAWKKVLARGIEIEGDSLKRAPQGLDPGHPLIEDLKRKDFVTSVSFTQAQVCGPRFLADFTAACRRMSPLVEFVTRSLGLPW
ncbi:MAG: hypothetical protein A2Y95_12475 [Deltaproteobacteria bacterium RBG_13_65_10]|nr:MAG: hypothetical protein A2Y95_12475 [Deltaproteobacteria bacterium RBG_13_65_10]